jgi:hypothetical protein
MSNNDYLGTVSIYSEVTTDENGDQTVGFNATDFADCSNNFIEEATALQALRTLDTRDESNVVPNTIGRTAVRNVLQEGLTYGYNDLKMRRKAEVLKHKHNRDNSTSKRAFSSIARGNTKYRHMSKARLEKLVDEDMCSTDLLIFSNPASFAGIRGDNTILYLDTNVPFYDKI